MYRFRAMSSTEQLAERLREIADRLRAAEARRGGGRGARSRGGGARRQGRARSSRRELRAARRKSLVTAEGAAGAGGEQPTRTTFATLVEAYLDDAALLGRCPRRPGLDEAMRYSLLAGGKRIRPVLALATARSLGARAASRCCRPPRRSS